MKNLIILTTVVIVLVGVIIFIYSGDTVEAPTPTPDSTPSTSSGPASSPQSTPISEESPLPLPTVSGSKVTVTYSNSGYGPATINIKRGDTVVFENKGSFSMWTASAFHPTHKAYPGSDIAKCGTQSQAGIFDACKGYGPGESWEFKFNEQGTWKYHNHMQANHTGTIVVE